MISEEQQKAMDHAPYRNVFGGLLHITTRPKPDMAIAWSMLAKFQNGLAPRHWNMMQQIVRYLVGTKGIWSTTAEL